MSLEHSDDGTLTVCSIIMLFLGDFLGVFSGNVRFTEHVKVIQAIPGPTAKLWLDYSQVTGTLIQMQVAKPGGDSNVRLEWEAVNEMDKMGPCVSWRVLVLATREIMPFEPLICYCRLDIRFSLNVTKELVLLPADTAADVYRLCIVDLVYKHYPIFPKLWAKFLGSTDHRLTGRI